MAFQPTQERDAMTVIGHIIAFALYLWAPKEIRDFDFQGGEH
jgi:hypothetical protein